MAASKGMKLNKVPAVSLASLSVLVIGLSLAVISSGKSTNDSAQAAQPTEGSKFVTVCHVPPGNKNNAQVITISTNAWLEGHTPHNTHDMDFVVTAENPNCPPLLPSPTRGG